ncbi:hypothetical protein [Burkholderia sp. JP2-270]|uniref:hypothetical protein n=1 Tax=Burkholderia sp. JP2-270 TaxID=2217913 RepID=UPI0013A69065|nr:hypothetical protein [Burkholderia sp. JP2-270]
MVEINKERVEVVRAEGSRRPVRGGEAADEAFRQGFVPDDRMSEHQSAPVAPVAAAADKPWVVPTARESNRTFELIY